MTVREAGQRLRTLLSRDVRYRSRWEPYAARGNVEISVAAVCRVIAEHLWETGERAETDRDLPRRLRDLVRRAIDGQVMTQATLRWFVEAFELSPQDEQNLRELLRSNGFRRNYHGSWQPPYAGTVDHRTISLHEHHYIGPDGWATHHETVQVLEALTDGVDRHVFAFDVEPVTVEMVQGGTLRQLSPPATGRGFHLAEIALLRPLLRGETTTIRYLTRFPPAPDLPTLFRRGARTPIENLDIRVQFDARRLPRAVSFAVWTSAGLAPAESQPVTLEPDLAVHRFVDALDGAWAGFYWSWGEDTG